MLANAGRDQLTLLLPLTDPGDSRNVEVNVRHSLVVLRDRIDKDAERLFDRWVIIAAGAGKMRDLHRNARELCRAPRCRAAGASAELAGAPCRARRAAGPRGGGNGGATTAKVQDRDDMSKWLETAVSGTTGNELLRVTRS